MAAEGPAMMRSSHQTQPGEGAPLLREGPRQLVGLQVAALGQSVSQAGEKGNNRRERNRHIRAPLIISPRTRSIQQRQPCHQSARKSRHPEDKGDPLCPNSIALQETEVPKADQGPRE